MDKVPGRQIFRSDGQTPIFTLAGESNATITTDSYAYADTRSTNAYQGGVLSSMAAMGFRHAGKQPQTIQDQQEPRVTNLGYNRSDSSSSGVWSDRNINMQSSSDNEIMDTFDVLALWSAHNYLSMLSREQLDVLRYIRPSLLHELLREVATAFTDLRNRRTLPNECGFCKNNGENEDYYSSHTLKDKHGRVLCPVLRLFQCPRCGATGDRAHTIKYCPEGPSVGGLVPPRQEHFPTSLMQSADVGASMNVLRGPVASSTTPNFPHTSFWSGFDTNEAQ